MKSLRIEEYAASGGKQCVWNPSPELPKMKRIFVFVLWRSANFGCVWVLNFIFIFKIILIYNSGLQNFQPWHMIINYTKRGSIINYNKWELAQIIRFLCYWSLTFKIWQKYLNLSPNGRIDPFGEAPRGFPLPHSIDH